MTQPSPPQDFATAEQLSNYWKPLGATEYLRAGTLLTYASMLIRQERAGIDADIVSGAISKELVGWVAMDMVKMAMLPGANEGKTQYQRVKGPFTDSASLVNPAGTLYLTADQLRRLGTGSATAPMWHVGDCP